MGTTIRVGLAAMGLAFASASSAAIVYKETPPLAYELEAWKAEMAQARADEQDRPVRTEQEEVSRPVAEEVVRPLTQEELAPKEEVAPAIVRPDEALNEAA